MKFTKYIPSADNNYSFMISLGKPIGKVFPGKKQNDLQELGLTTGIDSMEVAGRYSLIFSVARSFDFDEILLKIENKLKAMSSEIII